jgi:glucose-1-phosphate thymidylyltransferase
MKAVVPAAGQGTRLYPQTHTKPKPMVRVAGKPVLGHILDGVVASPIDEAVVVVGVMKEAVIEYVEDNYGAVLETRFVEQDSAEGLGHAVYQTRPVVGDDPMCIVLGDMLFERGYEHFLAAHREFDDVAGSIGVKRVDEPSNYGVVSLEDGRVATMTEKPDDPDSDLAISGIYVVEDSGRLFDALEHLVETDTRGAGDEYQLTDALQRLVADGATFRTFEVEEWYDCGRPGSLLEANRVLLERGRRTNHSAAVYDGSSVVLPPADIADDVTIEASAVGPYVSIDEGAEIVESRVANTIVGRGATLEGVNLTDSLVGDRAAVSGTPNELNVGDSSDVQL